MDVRQISEEVTARTKVDTTARDVEKVISCLSSSSHFWEIVCNAQKPFSVVAEIINALWERGFVSIEPNGEIAITQKGQEFIKEVSIAPRRDFTCPSCDGRGIAMDKIREWMQKFDELTVDRPKAIADYDQGYITTPTVMARVALMAERGDLEGKRLLVLGDDDLLSLAAAITKMPREIVVLEIDERLVDYINDRAQKLNLPVKAFKYDFRDSLPDQFVGSFDTFNTDPPETMEALEVCMTRGLSALSGEGCAGYFGLTRTESSLKKWNEFQQMLLSKFRVAITDIIDNFNHYVNWDYLLGSIRDDYSFIQVKPRLNWYRSSMYRIETVSGFGRIENKPMPCELYVDEEALIYKPEKTLTKA
nr:MAG: putative methyltransferase [Bacillota bacterium]